jgi:hypothetical protein
MKRRTKKRTKDTELSVTVAHETPNDLEREVQ